MANKIGFVFIAFFLITMIANVSAIGVTPGRTSVDFSPNLEKTINFAVINSEGKEINVAFSVQGELANYVSISNEIVKFSANENSKPVSYKINLPAELGPGLHTAKIVTTELPKDIDSKEMLLTATVSVVTQLYVYVPYPGKYLESDFNIVNKQNTNVIAFYIPLISRGKENINKARAVIEIYKGDSKITSFNTDEKIIKPGEKTELSALWDPAVASGEYSAIAILKYDSKETRLEKKFNVGNDSLDIVAIGTNNFQLGQIAKIRILVQNRLSDSINGASANMEVYDTELNSIANLKSESYDIPPLSNAEIVTYWDTETLEKGDYTSELKINYNTKFINKGFKIKVSEDSMDFTGIGFVVSSSSSGGVSTNTIIYIVVGILVLLNLAWLVYWLRNKKKSKK